MIFYTKGLDLISLSRFSSTVMIYLHALNSNNFKLLKLFLFNINKYLSLENNNSKQKWKEMKKKFTK